MSTALNFGTNSGGVGFAQVILQALLNYGESTATAIDFVLTNQNTPATIQTINLTSGNNTINATNCPALPQAGGVFIIPPAIGGAQMTIKGISADTGIPLGLNLPTFLPFNAVPPTSFVINAASTVTGLILAWV